MSVSATAGLPANPTAPAAGSDAAAAPPAQRSLLDQALAYADEKKITLPVFSDVAQKVQKASNEDTYDISQIERAIESDAALVAEVLRAANSAFFGGLAEVSSIKAAILRRVGCPAAGPVGQPDRAGYARPEGMQLRVRQVDRIGGADAGIELPSVAAVILVDESVQGQVMRLLVCQMTIGMLHAGDVAIRRFGATQNGLDAG